MGCNIERAREELLALFNDTSVIDFDKASNDIGSVIYDIKANIEVHREQFSSAFDPENIVAEIVKQNKKTAADKHTPKEIKKAEIATQYIGVGSEKSSTRRYEKIYADKANTGEYTASDVVWVSSNGNRKDRVSPITNGELTPEFENVQKAMDAGATIVMDTAAHVKQSAKYNIGEVELARFLYKNGYRRDSSEGVGKWTPIETTVHDDSNNVTEPEQIESQYNKEPEGQFQSLSSRAKDMLEFFDTYIYNPDILPSTGNAIEEKLTLDNRGAIAGVNTANEDLSNFTNLEKAIVYESLGSEARSVLTENGVSLKGGAKNSIRKVLEVSALGVGKGSKANRRKIEKYMTAFGKTMDSLKDNPDFQGESFVQSSKEYSLAPQEKNFILGSLGDHHNAQETDVEITDPQNVFSFSVTDSLRDVIESQTFYEGQTDSYKQHASGLISRIQDTLKHFGLNKEVRFKAFQTQDDVTTATIDINLNEEANAIDENTLHQDGGLITVRYGRGYSFDPNVREDVGFSTDGELLFHEVFHSVTESAIQEDPSVERKIAKVQTEIMKGITPDVFLNTIENPTLTHIRHAEDLVNYMNGKPSEFLAYAMTNPMVYNAIKDVKLEPKWLSEFEPKDGERLNKFKDFLNKMIVVINKVASFITLGSNSANTVLNSTVDSLMSSNALLNITPQDSREREDVYSPYEAYGLSDKYKALDSWLKKFDTNIWERIQSMGEGLNVRDKAEYAVSLIENVMKIKQMKWLRDSRFFSDVFNTVVEDTTDEDVSEFYEMFRQIKNTKDNEQVQMSSKIKKEVNSWFKGATKDGRNSVTKMLEVDWRGLGLTLSEFKDLVTNDAAITAEIDKLKTEVVHNEYIRQSADLGWFIANREGRSLFTAKNAHQIYYRFHQGVQSAPLSQLDESNSIEMINKIDRLSSLYALRYTDNQTRNDMVNIIESHPTAVDMASTLYYHNRDNEQYGDAFKSFGNLFEKGYMKKFAEVDIKFDIINESQVIERGLLKSNIIRERPDIQKLKKSNERHYLVWKNNYDTARTQGAIDDIGILDKVTSLSDFTASGTLDRFGLEQLVTEMKEERNIEYLSREFDDSFEAMSGQEISLVPATNIMGEITNFEIPISNADRSNYGRYSDDIADSLGTTVSHTSAKETAIINNFKFIDLLKRDSDENAGKSTYALLRPGNQAEIEHGVKYAYQEEWAMLPDYIRNKISTDTNGTGLWVKKTRLNNVVGYKDVSISNMKLFGKGLDGYPAAKEAVKIIEANWKQLAGRFKEIVVKLFPSVVLGNASSNMWVSMRHGIGPIEYSKAFVRHWNHLTDHQELSEEVLSLKIRRDSGVKGLGHRINALESQIKKNPMDKLVNDGQFGLILEDLDVNITSKSTHLEDKIGKFADESRFKNGLSSLNDFRKSIYLSKDTAAHKAIEKLTIFNDIINRSIILEKLNEDLDKANIVNPALKAIKSQDLLNYVDQLFVNYSYLDNKYLKWANDTNIMMFTKYFFRAAKAVKSLYTRHPLGSLGFEGLDAFVIDLPGPSEQYFSPVDSLVNRTFSNPLDMVWELLFPNIFNPVTH